jgi:transcriptional regulator with XRE-family HTH domain
MNDESAIGARIRGVRKRQGMSPAELAAELSLDGGSLRKLYARPNPPLATCHRTHRRESIPVADEQTGSMFSITDA